MASLTTKRICAKCSKYVGTAMCYGCEQAFCTKHFIEHRQELSQQIDSIGQEHDILQQDLTREQHSHPLLNHINQWEHDSIKKIQTAAKTARHDLHGILHQVRDNLKISLSKMTEELQSSQQSDDYTERDVKRWTDQLQKLRNLLNSPINVNINYENNDRSIIHLIKVTDQTSFDDSYQAVESDKLNQQVSQNLKISCRERFVDVFEKIQLSEDGLVATCFGTYDDWACVRGTKRYSSGIHYIHFGIEQLGKAYYTFIGIMNSSVKLAKDIWESTSLYGWFDLDYCVEGGQERRQSDTRNIRTGDEVTVVLHCDNRQIKLKHHRLNRIENISIDLEQCPFPWKIVVVLLDTNDCMRILP